MGKRLGEVSRQLAPLEQEWNREASQYQPFSEKEYKRVCDIEECPFERRPTNPTQEFEGIQRWKQAKRTKNEMTRTTSELQTIGLKMQPWQTLKRKIEKKKQMCKEYANKHKRCLENANNREQACKLAAGAAGTAAGAALGLIAGPFGKIVIVAASAMGYPIDLKLSEKCDEMGEAARKSCDAMADWCEGRRDTQPECGVWPDK